MKLTEIVSYLEIIAPKSFQESYDNSGLILGNLDASIKGIMVCLDVDKKAIDFALKNECQLIVSHHPAIFSSIKTFMEDTREGSLLVSAIKNEIALYSSHTNFDSVKGGLTDMLCGRIGLKNVNILKEAFSFNNQGGFGRYGEIDTVSGQDFIKLIMSRLSLNAVRFAGKVPDNVSKVAVYNGSYDRDVLMELSAVRPDVLITGDLKYHDAQELIEKGIFTIDAGHYGTEKLFVEVMSRLLNGQFPEIKVYRYEGADAFSYHIKVRIQNKRRIQKCDTGLWQ